MSFVVSPPPKEGERRSWGKLGASADVLAGIPAPVGNVLVPTQLPHEFAPRHRFLGSMLHLYVWQKIKACGEERVEPRLPITGVLVPCRLFACRTIDCPNGHMLGVVSNEIRGEPREARFIVTAGELTHRRASRGGQAWGKPGERKGHRHTHR